MRVFVINKHGRSLMPCRPRIARLLLRDGCAKVVRRDPFTIKLLIGVPGYKQELVLGIDPGTKYIGSAVRDAKNRILYLSEIHQRTDIKSKMDQRRMYRRTRRARKTRYRPPRFLNRSASTKKDRYPPSQESRYRAVTKEIEFVCKMIPISKIYIEMAKFDVSAMTNPAVLNYHWLYQKGPKFGYYNTVAFVLSRDGYTCQICKGKKKDPKLHAHHIIYRSRGGSNKQDNLLTLCKTCHDQIHAGTVKLTAKQLSAVKKSLKDATQMNVLCSMIQKRFSIDTFISTLGAIAKAVRQHFGYPKEHYYDAFFGSLEHGDTPEMITDRVTVKKCVAKGEYQRTKGPRSEKLMPTGKIQGFQRWDKVLYQGVKCFIKGRMSTGYAVLCDELGSKLNFKPMAKFTTIKRLSARKSWIMLT